MIHGLLQSLGKLLLIRQKLGVVFGALFAKSLVDEICKNLIQAQLFTYFRVFVS